MNADKSPAGISIIICCYNSSQRLPETLQHIAQQKVPENILWEIIIVNNASTDNTKEVAYKEWGNYNLPHVQLQVVDEYTPGLANARKKGVDVSGFEYLIFCDDDNWLNADYIQIAYNFLAANPRYAAIGGQSEAVFEKGFIPPDWFDEYKMGYAVGEQGEQGDITSRGYLWGAGIAFRKSVYKIVMDGLFPSLLLDRKGNELSAGGDSEMCLRFIIIGYKLYYTNKLKFKHLITANRLTLEYRIKLWDGFLESDKVLHKYHFYLKTQGSGDFKKQKIKITLKYWLSFFKIRRLTEIDERLIYVLTSYKTSKYDPVYQLIRDLKKLKQ